MRRGEFWKVRTIAGKERIVLVVAHDGINDQHDFAVTHAVEIAPTSTPTTILTVEIRDGSISGIAKVAMVSPFQKERFTEYLGKATAETMERVAIALRATFDI